MAQPPKTLASRIASVPHPIITVTQHTPSPTPTPSVSEEGPGGGSGGGGGGGAARPFLRDLTRRPVTLNRSYSDSDVSYSAEELTEAAGSTYYINKHGGIDLVMLLKGLHSVVLRNRQTNTLRVTEAIVSLLEIMLSMDVMLLDREEERQEGSAAAAGSSGAAATEETAEPERTKAGFLVHYLYMDILVRSFKHMGCAHGCREGYRGPSAEFLRSQAQLLLTRLLKIDERSFKKYMRELSSQSSIHELMEFLHSFVGWCGDHGQAASPMSE
ncbi:Protein unc-80 [Amphibalanus amphitrite]|uniref:Protein unc-80 n=1 Tax=Amphibalanus amphitrite TaxID=1232801 RepID=A0A6A4UZL1_AMPAM|nr:Protein unc-80 [Amphibalanus amphitrite]